MEVLKCDLVGVVAGVDPVHLGGGRPAVADRRGDILREVVALAGEGGLAIEEGGLRRTGEEGVGVDLFIRPKCGLPLSVHLINVGLDRLSLRIVHDPVTECPVDVPPELVGGGLRLGRLLLGGIYLRRDVDPRLPGGVVCGAYPPKLHAVVQRGGLLHPTTECVAIAHGGLECAVGAALPLRGYLDRALGLKFLDGRPWIILPVPARRLIVGSGVDDLKTVALEIVRVWDIGSRYWQLSLPYFLDLEFANLYISLGRRKSLVIIEDERRIIVSAVHINTHRLSWLY